VRIILELMKTALIFRPAIFLMFVAALLLGGCASSPRPLKPTKWENVPPANPQAASAVLMRAMSLIGTPYRFGGTSPETGFDCSGFIHYVYRDMLAMRLPRTTAELATLGGIKPKRERMAIGDLVLFGSKGRVWHAGIYIGEGRFIHAPNSRGMVRVENLDVRYWRENYHSARRVLR